MRSHLSFLLYDSRSGSTMLSALLEKFKFIFVTNESDFTSRILFRKDNISIDIVDFLFEDSRFVDLNISKEDITEFVKNEQPNYRELIEFIIINHLKNRYDSFIDSNQNIIIIKHQPIGYFSLIRETWANVRFIYLIRDGRDIHISKYNSIDLYNKKFSDNVFSSLLNWKKKDSLYSNISGVQNIITYESIINNKNPYQYLSGFLGTPNLIDESKRFPLPKNQLGFHKNVNSPIINNNREKFNTKSYLNFIYCLFAKKTLLKYNYNYTHPAKIIRLNYFFILFYEIIIYFFRTISNIFYFFFSNKYLFYVKLKKFLD